MRAVFLVIMLALVVVAATPDFYPMPKGAEWKYQGELGELVIRSLGDGSLEWLEGGKRTGLQRLQKDRAAVLLVQSGSGKAIEPPRPMLKLPLIFESQWVWEGTEGGQKAREVYHVTAVGTPVEVPAGKFSATRVDTKRTLEGVESSRITYYAPDVGMVKLQLGELTLELVSYKL